ncbi:MAG: C4-type zinc ribbon domain-containing protein [Bacillota bacterium]|nr:C4-type zinc ribbon domain-containing protein [Bacillota bacterium]
MTFSREQFQGLLELQRIDVQLERDRRSLAAAVSGAELTPLRERLAQAQAQASSVAERVGGLRRELRYSEQETQSTRNEIANNERRLYGGMVRNPKEADQMQQYVASLRRRVDQDEEKALALMMEIETLEPVLAASQEQATALTRELQAAQAGLADSISRLTAETPQLETQRTETAGALAPALLTAYEGLRARRGVGVVATVRDSKCEGCRVGLSFITVREVRSGELRTCDNCGRILVEP